MGRTEWLAVPHDHTSWDDVADALSAGVQVMRDTFGGSVDVLDDRNPPNGGPRDAFYILLPLLIVLSTFLFLLLLFLVCVILLRRRRGIMLRDNDGPIDMSREDLVEGEGGFEGVESRWLETVTEAERRPYLRAKGEKIVCLDSRCIDILRSHSLSRLSTSISSQLTTY